MGSNDTKQQKYIITQQTTTVSSISSVPFMGKKEYHIDLSILALEDANGNPPNMLNLCTGKHVCVLPYDEYEELLRAKETPKSLVEEKFDTYDHSKGEKICEF